MSEVAEAPDGTLFLVGGSNDPLRLFRLPEAELGALLSRWRALLLARDARARALGIRYAHCFAPDKLDVLRERLPAITAGMRFPAQVLEESVDEAGLGGQLIALSGYMRSQQRAWEMFLRTDTHWTIEGYVSAYQMICARLGLVQRQATLARRSGPTDGVWDLGSRLSPPRSETVRFGDYGHGARRVFAGPLVLHQERAPQATPLHAGAVVRFETPDAPNRARMLVFGDSYFEYRLNALTGMFAETVSELMFVWSASIDWRIVAEYRPTLLLTEMAERFMGVLPDDDRDVRAETDARLRAVSNGVG